MSVFWTKKISDLMILSIFTSLLEIPSMIMILLTEFPYFRLILLLFGEIIVCHRENELTNH